MIAYYSAQMSHVVRMCPYSNIQMRQVVKCVRHTNDRTNDHTNESLPINAKWSKALLVRENKESPKDPGFAPGLGNLKKV